MQAEPKKELIGVIKKIPLFTGLATPISSSW